MSHYEASLQRDVERLRSKLGDMAGRIERSLRDAIIALMSRNRQLAYSIILRDTFIDALDREIDRLCLEFIIRQQPVGLHLRFAAGAIKINLELERVGDYAKSIAKQTLKLSRLPDLSVPASLQQLADASVPSVGQAIEAFGAQDAEAARAVIVTASHVEEMRAKICDEILVARQEGKIPLEAYDPLITVVRRFERVASQAENIAQETIYMVSGVYAKHEAGAVMRVLFLDGANAGGSQMAEAIGNSLGNPRFIFSSAGLDPKPVDRGLIEFMAGKGIDISRAKSRVVSQVPNLEYYQVFVALTHEAIAAFPPTKAKSVNLEWILPDPAAGERLGTAAAYEATWNFLKMHITDLVQALLGEQEKAEH